MEFCVQINIWRTFMNIINKICVIWTDYVHKYACIEIKYRAHIQTRKWQIDIIPLKNNSGRKCPWTKWVWRKWVRPIYKACFEDYRRPQDSRAHRLQQENTILDE
jgi:hypothetical protein